MSEKVAVTQSYLQDVADAIREKTGSTATYKPSEFAAAVQNIQTESSGPKVCTGAVSITNRDLTNNPIIVEGLGFTPSYVLLVTWGSAVFPSATYNRNLISAIFINNSWSGSVLSYVSSSNYAQTSLGSCIDASITEDGFTLTGQSTAYTFRNRTYYYAAVG